jgi:hypothetical protein
MHRISSPFWCPVPVSGRMPDYACRIPDTENRRM